MNGSSLIVPSQSDEVTPFTGGDAAASTSEALPASAPLRVLHVSKSAAEFSYHEALIRGLIQRGHQVHALFDEGYSSGRSDAALQTFAASVTGFTTGWTLPITPWRRRATSLLQELSTLGSYLQRTEQSPFYLERFETGMSPRLQRFVKRRGLRSWLTKKDTPRRLQQLGSSINADPATVEWVRSFRPDVVIASPANMRHSFEGEYLRAAKQLGIPTVIPVFSWDNLTTKSLFPVVPDLLLAWNETQIAEARSLHHVGESSIAVTGAPLFDRWSDVSLGDRSREEFCARVGLDPRRPFVCYLGSTAGIAQDETWLVNGIAEELAKHHDPRLREVAILVRPHPLHAKVYEALESPSVAVWPREGHFPDLADALQDFHDSLRFAVGAVGINTTGMLDAVIVDRPCIAVLAERYRRTQELALHFQNLRGSGALEEVDSAAACVAKIGRLLEGEDSRAEQRRQFVSAFIRPRGLHLPAGAVAAEAIEKLALKRSSRR